MKLKMDASLTLYALVMLFGAGFNFVCYYSMNGFPMNLYMAWSSIVAAVVIMSLPYWPSQFD